MIEPKTVRELAVLLDERENRYCERHKRQEDAVLHETRIRETERAADQLAITKALESSLQLAEKHNDLIRQMEKKDDTYATKAEVNRLASWQARLTGGMLLLGAIGVGNLIKLLGV